MANLGDFSVSINLPPNLHLLSEAAQLLILEKLNWEWARIEVVRIDDTSLLSILKSEEYQKTLQN